MCCLGNLHFNLTGWEGFILHDNSAAAGQNHDVEVLLLIVGLLVPLPHHIRVMGGNQSDLGEGEILSKENSEAENSQNPKSYRTDLHIGIPLSLSFEQSIKNSPTWLLSGEIIATDHVIRGAHPVEELCIHILSAAMIRDVNQIHVHRGTVWQ